MPNLELSFRIARADEIKEALLLVRRVFTTVGYVKPGEEKAIPHSWAKLFYSPHTSVFVAESDGVLLGAVTLKHDSSEGIQMDRAFTDLLWPLRDRQISFAEVGRLSVDTNLLKEKFGTHSQIFQRKILMGLFKAVVHHSLARGISHFTIAVEEHHRSLYDAISFVQLGEARLYSSQDGKIKTLEIPMVLDLRKRFAEYQRARQAGIQEESFFWRHMFEGLPS